MKKILLTFLLLSALPTWAQNMFTPVDVTPPTTISAQCSTPTVGCSAGQWVTAKLGGRGTIGAVMTPSVFTSTLACFFSKDNGINWFQGLIRSGTTESTGGYAVSSSYAASSTITNLACTSLTGAATDVAVVATAAVTNTAVIQLVTSNVASKPIEAIITTKGTQSVNSTGITTQDLKDAGRSFVVISADSVTPAIAETVITFQKNVAGTVTTAQTTYAITAAKTLRLQSLVCSLTAGAAANRVRVAIRLNTGGACVAGSNLLAAAMELTPTYGTATANEGGAYGEMAIPDGLELTGASWNICLTESAAAASGTLTCTLTGYEY